MSKLISLSELYKYIEGKMKVTKRVVLAIDGNACAGKTTLANLLSRRYEATIIHVDDFYKARDKDKGLDLTSKEGNIDYDRFKSEIIDKLNDETLLYKKFNCSTQTIDDGKEIKLNNLIIVEGTYSKNPRLHRYFDASIFLKIEDETQVKRLKKRNSNNFEWFLNTWVRLERNYFDEYKVSESCDFIMDGDALDLNK